MAEWTPWDIFDSAVEVDRLGQRRWDNEGNALNTNLSNWASTDLTANAGSAESDWLRFSRPKVASLVPVGSTINQIGVNFWVSQNDDLNGLINLVQYQMLDGNTYPLNTNMTPAVKIIGREGTISTWGLNQAEAESFLYGPGTTKGIQLYMALAAGNFTQGRVHSAQCRVQFTRPPNQPRTAYIAIF